MNLLLGLVLILAIALIAYFLGVFGGAPFLPTYRKTVTEMIAAAKLKEQEKIADLGSGDGRLLIAAAKAQAEAHGFEINPLLVWLSRYKIKKAGLGHLAFVHTKNFWYQDFSSFDVVFVFGIESIMPKLESKLQQELKPGARVISNIFHFPTWPGEKIGSVYVYKC